jgi:cytochrome bd-type quinol oxidase subunit 1
LSYGSFCAEQGAGQDDLMTNTLVFACSITLALIFLCLAVVCLTKMVRLKKQLYQTRYNLILCRGSRPLPQAKNKLALFFDEKTNEFKPLAVKDGE